MARWLPRSLKPGTEHSEQARSLRAAWPMLTLDEMIRLDRVKHVLLESGCSDGRSADDGTYQRPFSRRTYSRLMFQRWRATVVEGAHGS